MAKGTQLIFDAAPGYIANKTFDLNGTLKMALISDPVTTLTVSESDPELGLGNINEVAAGGGYTSGGKSLSLSNSISGSTYTMALNTATHVSGLVSWTSSTGSPNNVKTAVIYDTATSFVLSFIDLTEDGGSTAIDLEARDIEVYVGGKDGANTGKILTFETSN